MGNPCVVTSSPAATLPACSGGRGAFWGVLVATPVVACSLEIGMIEEYIPSSI